MRAAVQNNSILFQNPNQLKRWEGKEIDVSIKKWTNSRTARQNRYYFGVVLVFISNILSDYLGENITVDDAHTAMRLKFLSRIIEKNGKSFKLIKSTTKLKTAEFEEYLLKIRTWASEFASVFIPLPNEEL